MPTKYLIDSNCIIDHPGGSLPSSGMNFLHGVVNDFPMALIITKVKVLGGKVNL